MIPRKLYKPLVAPQIIWAGSSAWTMNSMEAIECLVGKRISHSADSRCPGFKSRPVHIFKKTYKECYVSGIIRCEEW